MLSSPRSAYSHTELGSPQPSRPVIQVDKHDLPGTVRVRKVLQKRLEVSHPKVRTGCHRCKQRRIKCDETQPQCLRCLRINASCPGSNQPVTRIFGLSVPEGFDSGFGQLCFDSFFAGGSSRLTLSQPSSTPFWVKILPQLCQVYLPLRHAVITISYINEPFHNLTVRIAARASSPLENLVVVMTHFNKALRFFNLDIHRLDIEAKVSCCIVFTALTIYMYRVGVVSSHVSAAAHFLRQHEAETCLGNPVLRQILIPIISRLVIDACTFSGGMNGYRHGDDNPYQEHMSEILKLPKILRTCQDAYESLCNILKYSIAKSAAHFEMDSRVDNLLQGALRRFDVVFAASKIESYGGKKLSNEQIAFHRKDILLQHRVARLISSFRPDISECSYQAFDPEFQAIFDSIKELIETEPQDP